jgi:hypothetical protein
MLAHPPSLDSCCRRQIPIVVNQFLSSSIDSSPSSIDSRPFVARPLGSRHMSAAHLLGRRSRQACPPGRRRPSACPDAATRPLAGRHRRPSARPATAARSLAWPASLAPTPSSVRRRRRRKWDERGHRIR